MGGGKIRVHARSGGEQRSSWRRVRHILPRRCYLSRRLRLAALFSSSLDERTILPGAAHLSSASRLVHLFHVRAVHVYARTFFLPLSTINTRCRHLYIYTRTEVSFSLPRFTACDALRLLQHLQRKDRISECRGVMYKGEWGTCVRTRECGGVKRKILGIVKILRKVFRWHC